PPAPAPAGRRRVGVGAVLPAPEAGSAGIAGQTRLAIVPEHTEHVEPPEERGVHRSVVAAVEAIGVAHVRRGATLAVPPRARHVANMADDRGRLEKELPAGPARPPAPL